MYIFLTAENPLYLLLPSNVGTHQTHATAATENHNNQQSAIFHYRSEQQQPLRTAAAETRQFQLLERVGFAVLRGFLLKFLLDRNLAAVWSAIERLIKGSCEIVWLVCEKQQSRRELAEQNSTESPKEEEGLAPTTTKKSYGDNATLVAHKFWRFFATREG